MEHIYKFGGIDATGSGIRNNQVEVTVRLDEKKKTTRMIGDEKDWVLEFGVSACVYSVGRKDIICGGQCLDTLRREYPELANNALYCKIYDLWEKYHLNTLHAGTPAQEKALKEAVADGKLAGCGINNYGASCAYLHSIGLLEDKEFMVEKDGEPKPYKYGTGWIAQEIPPEDLEICLSLAIGECEAEPIKKDKPKSIERD